MDYSNMSDSDLAALVGAPPLSVENNNPGNMKSGDVLASYDSPQAGLSAMQDDLTTKVSGNSHAMKINYGQNYKPTLRNVLTTWAPPIENDTENYINYVSKNSGISPDQVMTADDVQKIIPHMITMEGGKKASQYFAQNNQTANDANVDNSPDYSKLSDQELSSLIGLPNANTQESNKNSDSSSQGSVIDSSPLSKFFKTFVNTTLETAKDAATKTGEAISEPLNSPNAQGLMKVPDAIIRTIGKVGNIAGGDFNFMTSPGVGEMTAGVEGSDIVPYAAKAIKENLVPNDPRFTADIPPGARHDVEKSIGNDLNNAFLMYLGSKNGKAAQEDINSKLPPVPPAPGDNPNPVMRFLKDQSSGGSLPNFQILLDEGSGGPIPDLKALSDIISPQEKLPESLSKTDSGQQLLVSSNGVKEGLKNFKAFTDTDGIDLNKTADTLEEMQKTNPDATALDAMTKNEGDIPTGANISGLAKSIASSPGQGRTMIAEMSGRGQQAANRIGNFFDQTISNLPYSKVKSGAIQAKEGTGPLYEQAFANNQNMNSPKINQILNRPAGKAALNNAATTMQNDGALVAVSNPDLVEQAALTGQLSTGSGIANGLKMRTLHYVKQELWDLAQKERDPNTMKYSANGNAILGQYHDLVGEMNANDLTRTPNNPNSGAYAKANQTYSTGARQQAALEQGTKFHQMRPDDISSYLGDKTISDPEKAAFLSGVRERLQTIADRKNPGQNPINSLSKIDMLKKYQALAGNKAPVLLKGMENEAHMARNDNLLSGSQTYSNEAFSKNKAVPQTIPGHILREIPGGGSFLGNIADKALAKNSEKMSADSKAVIARILTTKDPAALRNLATKIK